MRQVVSLGQGQCGISIQEQIWLTLLKEQGLDLQGVSADQNSLHNPHVYFQEVKENVYKPRTILSDIDLSRIDQLECGILNRFFMGTSMIASGQSSGNNYAMGNYTVGSELKDQIEDSLRLEVEKCDALDSIQIQRSTCGGAGSGLGTIVLGIARELYCDQIVNSLVHMPNLDGQYSSILEIYNTILSLQSLVELSDLVIPFANGSIQSIIDNSIQLKSDQSFKEINAIVAQIHPGMTCNIRYPGTLNTGSRKISTNLTPFPRIKFMTITYLPLNYYKASQSYSPDYTDMIKDCLNPNYFIFNQESPFNYCSQHMFRGTGIYEEELERNLSELYNNTNTQRVEWIATPLSISYCSQPSIMNNKQILSILNNRNLYQSFKQYGQHFTQMFRRKVFLHTYTFEGMDEMEFCEAESNLNDLISENTPYNYAYEEEFEEEYLEEV